MIERNPVEHGELGTEELEEFRDEVGDLKPESAARWLQGYLEQVRSIYRFQLLGGTEEAVGWDAVHAVQWEIWTTLGGSCKPMARDSRTRMATIILWQFSDDVTGPWNMAVLNATNRWVPFEMDLGEPGHRRAFLAGEVPKGVPRL